LVVLVDAFCNHFAELLAVGAEDGKTNGRKLSFRAMRERA
jgi:hypothetical protein